MMNELIETLRTEQYALVILHEGNISTFEGRGVRTLYNILEERPELLLGAKAAIKAAGASFTLDSARQRSKLAKTTGTAKTNTGTQ